VRTQIKIYDTRLENFADTYSAEINPPGPLRVVFCVDGKMTATHMDYKGGLAAIMESLCKYPQYVRKLKIEIELENSDDNHSR